jgi:hypothetical protein
MKKGIKQFICITVLATSVITGAYCTYADDVKVTVDGKEVAFDVPPQIIEGRTMVPVRAIFEAVGADVQWDEKTQTVTGTKDGTTIQMTIDSDKLLINGAAIHMDCVPIKKDNRVLTPARYVVESYGYVATWDEVGSTVKIMSMDEYKKYVANGGTPVDTDGTQTQEKKGFWASVVDWFKGLFSKK